MTIRVYDFDSKISNLEKQVNVMRDYVIVQLENKEYKEALRVLQECIEKQVLLEEYRSLNVRGT